MSIESGPRRGTHRRFARCLPLTFAIAAVSACQRSPGEPPHTTAAPPPPSATATTTPSSAPAEPAHPWVPPTGTANVQGAPDSPDLVWDDPPGWERTRPASPMRRAQYRIPRVAGDTADAELLVITFGPGQGGDTESNLQRWYGQVTQPDGRETRAIATRRTLQAGSMNITLTEVTGRLGGSGGMPGMPQSPPIEHGRLLAAIVETPTAPWFFKITGPDATVAAARPAFESMLRSLHSAPAPH
jgi:hypothetical protein